MRVFDLRQLTSRQLEPLFAEEQRHWLEELQWNYAPSQQLIRKFMDARSLFGFAALVDHTPAGYTFYILEDRKGLIGGLYATDRPPSREAACRALLAETLDALRAVPRLERIEAQLMPFGLVLDPLLREFHFRLYGRQFMLLPLDSAPAPPGTPADSRPAVSPLAPWDDRYLTACARLMQLAYANHIDSEVNDQYHSETGALKFLKNITILPGCGRFLPDASFILRSETGDRLVGAVLTSEVSPGVAHTTQICVMPGYQGHGLGRRLMQASIEALRARRFHALSLTVTSLNSRAVLLYEKLGFQTRKTFSAAVWKA